jgi:hypothetical protein
MELFGTKNLANSTTNYFCHTCDYKTANKYYFTKHKLTRKHLDGTNGTANLAKKTTNFICEKCNFRTDNKSNFIQHKMTRKHRKSENLANLATKTTNNHICEVCNKQYKYASGLWKHKNTTHQHSSLVPKESTQVPSENELIKIVMEENAKLHAAIKELIPHVGNNNNNTTNNKKFNINIFLNETCKDAINMKDFIKNIQITLKDVMHAAENGVLSSSRNLVLKGLQDMEITTRPIHCTDVKRNTMYIKDKGAWNKDQDNEELKKTMQCVSTKHVKAIKEWEAAHPNYMDSDKGQQEYIRIVQKITQSVVQHKRDMQCTIKNVAEKTHLTVE